MATIRRERNDLAAAAELARRGLDLSERWGQAEIVAYGAIEMAQVHQARGETEAADAAMARAREIAAGLSPWFADVALALEAWLRLQQGNPAAAFEWAQRAEGAGDDVCFRNELALRIRAQILLVQGELDEAQALLGRLLDVTQAAGAGGSTIDLLAMQASLFEAQGAPDRALAALERALSLAEGEGYVRTFADKGAPMAALLRRAAAEGIKPEYAGKLLAACAEGEARPASPPVEPLSERERTVLRLIAAGLANREIAQELVVSLNTVKSHVKSVYGKLDAHNRTQAVNRARELGLL
jgi:LuxR family maltose regulon positive regulatory protein